MASKTNDDEKQLRFSGTHSNVRRGPDAPAGEAPSAGGSYWDRLYMTEQELRDNDSVRSAAQRGEIGWDDAHSYVQNVRKKYGYSGGDDGSQYIPLAAVPALPDSYGAAYRETLKRYTDMAPFSYDAASDPAYQAYKKQYAREGARSAENTLGQYAAMTGGVPSTAAVTAAQQAGDYYAAQMSDKLPELYDLAYAMYKGEGERLYKQLAALRNAGSDELERYLAALDVQNDERLKNQPALTLAQVNAAIAEGNLAPKVLEAYEYYYGAPYAAPEPTPAGAYGPTKQTAPGSDAPDADAGANETPAQRVDYTPLVFDPAQTRRTPELIIPDVSGTSRSALVSAGIPETDYYDTVNGIVEAALRGDKSGAESRVNSIYPYLSEAQKKSLREDLRKNGINMPEGV